MFVFLIFTPLGSISLDISELLSTKGEVTVSESVTPEN
jgi:hypothetical protein